MNKAFLFLGMVLSTNLYAAQLMNYDQVLSAINNGDTVRINIDFNLCKTANNKAVHVMHGLGAFTPNEVIVNENGDILASLNHFTTNDPQVPHQPVYQYVRYQIDPSNSVLVTVQVLDAATYKNVANTMQYTCQLGDSVKIYKKA